MNEEDRMGKEVAKLLNCSLDDIDQKTLHRLQSARRAALENYEPSRQIYHAGAAVSAQGGHDGFFRNTNKLLLSIIVLLILLGSIYWKNSHETDENAAIDTMILADDLPVEAYIDDEFSQWLDSTR